MPVRAVSTSTSRRPATTPGAAVIPSRPGTAATGRSRPWRRRDGVAARLKPPAGIGIPEGERRSESIPRPARPPATGSHQDRPYSVTQLRCAAHGCPRGLGIGPLG